MRNIKLIIKFDGTNYHGWQIQNNGITIQQVLTAAVSEIVNEPDVKLVGCGRTDAGVHACMYVVNFHTNSQIPAKRFPFALNTILPDDIVCVDAQDVNDNFDASRSAVKKKYTYRIHNSQIPDPFIFPFTHREKVKLDLNKMKIASEAFIGTHDFVGFASVGYSVKTTVRTIFSLEISEENDVISIAVTGDGFLYNMVRIIAGTLIAVGAGRISPDEIPDIINSKKRENAGPTAPAKGLCLTEVYY
ncbi:MAG: tRNA pseudouridine(38-40) synthase TruA [Clostridia bacterium]|nr:tRNA pseudouridine(38-40) synthase TruA [Clostridia bacterium]